MLVSGVLMVATMACAVITYSLVVTLWVMRSAADLVGIGR